MQIVFEVGDSLVTCSCSTSITNPALLAMLISWRPSMPPLSPAQQTRYGQGKTEALAAVTAVLGVSPMIVEPAPPAARRR